MNPNSLVLDEGENLYSSLVELSTNSLQRQPLKNVSNISTTSLLGSHNGKKGFPLKKEKVGALKTIFDRLILSTRRLPAQFPGRKQKLTENQLENVETDHNSCLCNGILDVDEQHRENHLYCFEYINDIYQHLREIELKRKPSPNYMSKQKEINVEMRSSLIGWLINFADEFNIVPETLFLSINYIDRFLSRKNVPKHRLQLVGVAAIFVASKYEEVQACKLEEVVEYCGYIFPEQDILAMEMCLLQSLDFEMTAATIHIFSIRFLQVALHLYDKEIRLPYLVQYLNELVLFEYCFLRFPSSIVALSSVVVGLHALDCVFWSPTLEYFSEINFEQLSPCINLIHQLHVNVSLGKLIHDAKFIRRKFMKSDKLGVASILPSTKQPVL